MYNKKILNRKGSINIELINISIRLIIRDNMEKINFYKNDEAMSWVAATTFTDVHHGSAISDEELKYRKQLQEDYKEEIDFVKLMVKDNPYFDELSYEDKINFAANLMVSLREKKENNGADSKGNTK